jgi:hypothetical protein
MFEKIGALLLTALLASTIVSCASAGRKLDRTHLGEIQEGVQSKQQIREWFGEPYRELRGLHGHLKGCVDRWLFEYAEAQGRAGTVTYTETLVVDFDAKGIVCDHAFAKSGEE